MIRIRSFLLATAVAGIGSLFSAGAETVYMKSGETIEGKIVEEQPGQFLRIKVSPRATWVLYFKEIDRVERDGESTSAVAKAAPAPVREAAQAPAPVQEVVVAPTPAPTPETAPAPAPAPEAAPIPAPAPAPSPTSETTPTAAEPSHQIPAFDQGRDTARPVINRETTATTEENSSAPAFVPFNRANGSASRQSYPCVTGGFIIGPDFFHEYGTTEAGSGSNDSRTGIVIGAILDIAPSQYFSIQPGISYAMRGATYKDKNDKLTSDNLSYLAIPIDFKIKIPSSSDFTFYFLGGVNFGFLMSASSEGRDLSSLVNIFDFGLDLGAGMEFPAGKVIPFMEFVYYGGLTDITNQTFKTNYLHNTGITYNSMVNSGFELRAGIRFPF